MFYYKRIYYYVLFVDDIKLRKYNKVLLCEILYDEMGYDPWWLDRNGRLSIVIKWSLIDNLVTSKKRKPCWIFYRKLDLYNRYYFDDITLRVLHQIWDM